MIISPNIIRILFGWDGLGLVSYCLVIFYQNYSSYNSGIVTVLCNRVGDVGILMRIGLILIKGRWNIWFLDSSKILIFILLLAAITKRAQVPFSTWLPIAIAAPTPVSALVHSSTLVTAGVYLIIRFNKFLLRRELNIWLFFLSVLTMFIAGIIANVENDLKKIIALSTLRQLGLIIIILSLNFHLISFYHLLTHAIFKSILFICAGIIIHSIVNNQDIRLFGNLNEIIPFTIIRFFISNIALCGFPFISGFYSKDLIMELVYNIKINIFMLIMVVVSLMLTVSYSFRLFYYIFFNNIKFYRFYNFKEDKLMNCSIIILILMRIFIGSILNWIFFFDIYVIYLDLRIKLITLGRCLIGLILGIIFCFKIFIKYYYLIFFLRIIWFLNYLYIWIYEPVNKLGVNIYNLDKRWIEFSRKGVLLYIIKYLSLLYRFKIYMFSFIFIYTCILVFLLY